MRVQTAPPKLLPLSNTQRKLYTYHQLFPNDPSYNLNYWWKIEGELDLQRFIRIWELLFNSSAIMKVHFVENEGIPHLVYQADRTFRAEIEEMDVNKEEADQIVREKIMPIAEGVPDLKKWPNYQVKVYRQSSQLHYLWVQIPHILFDGYSGYHLLSEVTRLYNSSKTLDELEEELSETIDELYFDFIDRTQEETKNQKALTYFKSELSGLDSLEIENFHPHRDQNGRIKGESFEFLITPPFRKQIDEYMQKNNFTEFSFFLSVNLVMLYKLTGQSKIVIGIPLANRDKKMKKAFGYFVNTLPLTVDFDEIDTFEELCQIVKRKTISLIRYQDFDLTRFMPELLGKRNRSHIDMYSAVFTYYMQPITFELENCLVTQMSVPQNNLMFPLNTSVEKTNRSYRVKMAYHKELKHANLKNIFLTITEKVCSSFNRKTPINEIHLMSFVQQNDLFECIHSDVHDIKENHTLYEAIQKQVQLYPDRIAVKFGDQTLTYRELDERSNKLAHYLLQHLPEETKEVAISLSRSHWLIIAILGILKAGRAYVPIDPITPAERMQAILDDLEHPYLITQEAFISKVKDQATICVLEEIMDQIENMPTYAPETKVSPDQTAYIIYTSGSTGNPKGVMISHQNVLQLFKAFKKELYFSAEDTWPLFHSYGFDFSVWEIFGALLHGGKLVVVPEAIAKAPNLYYQFVLDEKVTILNQTPSAFQSFMKVALRSITLDQLNLRYLFLGGEAVHFYSLKPWIEQLGDEKPKIYNLYGPTEITIIATYHRITKEDVFSPKGSIIGRPLPDLDIYVVNRLGEIVPTGIAGELIIGGNRLAKGYYNRPEETKKRFIPDFYQNERVYRTGDKVRILPNGTLEYLGRLDHQVQLRGYRIELGEIESALQQHPDIIDQVVTVASFATYDQRLVAYVVLKDNKELDEHSIRSFLRKRLPEYMIPSLYMKIDKKPLTINGKVDLSALPSPIRAEKNALESGNPVEQKIMTIWQNVLKHDQIRLDDNFFDVGGTSLHIPEIYYQLNATFQLQQLSLVDLFQYTTIRQQAEYIKKLEKPTEISQDTNEVVARRKQALLKRRRARKEGGS